MVAPLRIALVVDPITALIEGGRHPVELSKALGARGHEVRIFGLPPDWLGGGNARGEVERRLGPSVRSFEPDGIVAYDSRSPAAWLGARVARRRDVPLILVEADGWSERSRLQRALWGIGESLWGRYVRRAADAVVALDSLARQSSLGRGFSPDTVDVVPSGVDIARYRPGLASGELMRRRIRGRILSCRLPRDTARGHEVLVGAFAATVGQREDWSLVFLGAGAAPPDLRACADRLGIGSQVHFLEVEEAAVAAVLSSSTLFAAPADSRRAPLDVERAFACGVPVLAVDAPRLATWMRADEHGLLAREGDLAAWAAILRDAAGSPERRKRWGRNAHQLAEERFGWDTVAARFERRLHRGESTLSAGEAQRVSLPARG